MSASALCTTLSPKTEHVWVCDTQAESYDVHILWNFLTVRFKHFVPEIGETRTATEEHSLTLKSKKILYVNMAA